MSNLLLGWPNRVYSATLSGGSWSTSLPLTNLQTQHPAVVARSADATTGSTKVLADLGAAHSLRGFALGNHNLSQSAQIKVLLGTTSGASDVYAGSFLDAHAITFGTGSDEWSSLNWWSPLADDDYVRSPWMASAILPAFYSARYVTIEISDTSNTDGWVQFGQLFIGGGFVPERGASVGATDGWEARSDIDEMESGGEVIWPRRSRRVATLDLPVLTTTEAGVMHELQRRSGLHGDVLYVPDMGDRVTTQRYGFIGRHKALDPIAYPSYRRRSVSLTLAERL